MPSLELVTYAFDLIFEKKDPYCLVTTLLLFKKSFTMNSIDLVVILFLLTFKLRPAEFFEKFRPKIISLKPPSPMRHLLRLSSFKFSLAKQMYFNF